MSWSLPGWTRQPGTFQLVLGYGEKSPTSTSDDQKVDAASECAIRVQLEWGAGEDEEGVVLKLQSQLMMALPYPEEEVQVRMVPQIEAAQMDSGALPSPSSKPPELNETDSNPPASPNSSKATEAMPTANSWGFLDRLRESIGRGAGSESVPSTPSIEPAPADPWQTLPAVPGSHDTSDVRGTDEQTSKESVTFQKASDGQTPNELLESTHDGHSKTESFVDAPHNLPPEAPPRDTAIPSTSDLKAEAPEAVSSEAKVPVRTVVKIRNERLRVILLSRTAGTGPVNEGLSVLNKIVEEGELAGVEHLALPEGMLGFWTQRPQYTWRSLDTLNLSNCNLTVVPSVIAQLSHLRVLLLDHNKLVAPPAELGKLTALRKLSMDHNLLLSVPIELRECTSLSELSLEHNRLVRPLLDFRSMARTLQTLRLFGNPLEFLPEILPCAQLRHLSLANVRIEGDPELTSVDVKVEDDGAATSYYFGGSKHRLSTFFQLIFRYSSCQHPLLASALARIAEDSENRAYIGRDEGAIRQLLSMVLSDDTHVVQQACKALSSIAMDTTLVARLVKADVLQSIWAVLGSKEPEIQVSVLQVLASVAFCSNSIAARLFTPDMLHRLKELCGSENTPKVREEALLVLGNLAFSPSNRRAMASAQGLRSLLARIAFDAQKKDPLRTRKTSDDRATKEPNSSTDNNNGPRSDSANCPTESKASPVEATFNDMAGNPKTDAESSVQRVRASAVRALAVMGENELVRKATQRRAIGVRGVKILSLDGGGMRGMATVQMLRRLEEGTGRRIHELFDLICGTSTGAMLAVALGVNEMSLDECEGIYKRLGKIVFAAEDKDKEKDAAASFATWREKLDSMYKSGAQNLRVVIHGAKHDATPFESLLKEMSAFEDGRNLLIETAGRGGPKVAVVSTLVSVTPAQPFVFRNYQYPPGTIESAPWAAPQTPLSPQIHSSKPSGGGGGGGLAATPAATPVQSRVGTGHGAYMGSCKHLVWQAIRASSAAPYYMDDFSDGNNRWQDGAVTANNPAIIAVREARLLWPDVPIDTLVSLGCASLPTKPRGKNWKHVDTGAVLVESSCSVERVEEALDTLAPLVPNLEYVRFQPVDESGGMELDETDPVMWAKLERATQDYIDLHDEQFSAVCALLTSDLPESSNGEPFRSKPSERPSEAPRLTLPKTIGQQIDSDSFSRSEGKRSWSSERGGESSGNRVEERSDGKTDGNPEALAPRKSDPLPGVTEGGLASPPLTPRNSLEANSEASSTIDRGFSFSHSFAFGGEENGEVPFERRGQSSSATAQIDLNPNAANLLDGTSLLDGPSQSVTEEADKSEPQQSLPEAKGQAGSEEKSSDKNETSRLEGFRKAAALGLRKGLLFVEAPPESTTSGDLLLKHSCSHQPLIQALCDQNKISRELFNPLIHTKSSKPGNRPVLTRPVSSPSLVSPVSRSDSLCLSPSLSVTIKREFRGQEPSLAPEEPLSFPTAALYHRLQNGQNIGVVHLALSGDEKGLIVEWQSDMLAVAEPGEEARAFLAKLGGRPFASLAELCVCHRQFDVGSTVYSLIGRHVQVLPGGNEVSAFIFQRSVPSVHLTSEDVRQMVGAWRDRIVVSSRVSLTRPVIEALLDGGAKAVFELVRPDEASDGQNPAPAETDGVNEPSVSGVLSWTSAFTPTAEVERNERGSAAYEPQTVVSEDSALEELLACLYSALYKEGLSIDQVTEAVDKLAASKRGYRLLCHLPSH